MGRAAVNQSAERRFYILAFALAFLFALTFPFRWPPVADAAQYVYASQTVSEGRGLWRIDPHTGADMIYSQWPPLYPLTLAALRLVGLDAQIAARLLNAACYALTFALVWRRIGGLALALLTPVFTTVYTAAWSEPAFILLVTIYFVLLFEKPPRLWALALVGALAVMQRYSGVVLVGVGCAYITLESWRLARARAGVVAMAEFDAHWIVIRETSSPRIRVWTSSDQHAGDPAAVGAGGRVDRWRAGALAAFIALYTAFVVVNSVTQFIDLPEVRLLSPVFVPGLFLLNAIIKQRSKRRT